jgi:anaerobic magnesium-protoporphyrin IX monomethyl ester cyclase
MIGIPGENPQTVQNTIDFAIKVNPHIANFSMVVPLPQTELFDMIKHGGKFINDVTMGSKTGFYTDDSNFEYGGVNPAFIHTYASKAYKDFYLRPSKIFDILLSIQSFGELRWIVDTAKPLVRFLCT